MFQKPKVDSNVSVTTDHIDYFKTCMPNVLAAQRFHTTTGVVVEDFKWINYPHFCVATGNIYHPIAVIPLRLVTQITINGTTSTTRFEEDTSNKSWVVNSSKKKQNYIVTRKKDNWSCTCPGFRFRQSCKHIQEIKESEHAN